MKIAVIGGNLLGCATALDLALVQAHDERKAAAEAAADRFEVTLFERTSRLGGDSLKSVPVDDDLHVEVGAYRTLPLPQGSFLRDLVDAANGALGAVVLFGRALHLPGSVHRRRGAPGAAPTHSPFASGSYGRVVRSFGAWDWRDDAYHALHAGWAVLDVLHRLLDNAIWRSLALGALLWAARQLDAETGYVNRAVALVPVVVLAVVVIVSPRRIVRFWQTHYSFWATTLPQLLAHGITPAISRGSTIGFAKHLADVNARNAATVAVSVAALLRRTDLDAYVRGSGEDYARKFRYERCFVQRYMAPFVAVAYAGARMRDVSSLAAHFAMLDADYTNSDVETRLQCVAPTNDALCAALLDAARASMPVHVRLETHVAAIAFDARKQRYRVTLADGAVECFDGIALCATPRDGEMLISTQRGATLGDMLGYDRDAAAAKRNAEIEAGHRVAAAPGAPAQPREGEAEEEEEEEEAVVGESACSHIAVVVGRPRASFFRFGSESQIPDVVQATHAPFGRFERVRDADGAHGARAGVYRVVCGADFERGGLFDQMFEPGAELRYHARVHARGAYSQTPVPAELELDEYAPFIVLGKRFVFAAACDALARHPEMDAIAAMNAASLFSRAVTWGDAEDVAQGDDDGEGEGDTTPGEAQGAE